MGDASSITTAARYAVEEILENGDNSMWWRNRVNDRINGPVQARLGRNDGVDLIDREWDTLLVLDACRADLFEAVAPVEAFDSYTRVRSRGSATSEWTRANFAGSYPDTVYVNANPSVARHVEGEFFAFDDVWRDAFDPDLATVPPERVTDRARERFEDHPDKRFVVHYLQPHYPFVTAPDLRFTGWGSTDAFDVEGDDRARYVWEALGRGFVDEEAVRTGYRENLEYVIEQVQPLLETMDGRIVVHSDHGNAFGERSWPVPVATFGHPSGLGLDALRMVPWAVVDDGSRRAVTSGTAADGPDERETDDRVDAKLAALGYVDQ